MAGAQHVHQTAKRITQGLPFLAHRVDVQLARLAAGASHGAGGVLDLYRRGGALGGVGQEGVGLPALRQAVMHEQLESAREHLGGRAPVRPAALLGVQRAAVGAVLRSDLLRLMRAVGLLLGHQAAHVAGDGVQAVGVFDAPHAPGGILDEVAHRGHARREDLLAGALEAVASVALAELLGVLVELGQQIGLVGRRSVFDGAPSRPQPLLKPAHGRGFGRIAPRGCLSGRLVALVHGLAHGAEGLHDLGSDVRPKGRHLHGRDLVAQHLRAPRGVGAVGVLGHHGRGVLGQPSLLGKPVVQRVAPLMRQRAGAAGLGQVDLVDAGHEVRRGLALALRAKGDAHLAVETHGLDRQAQHLGQVHQAVVGLVQVGLALSLVDPPLTAEVDAAEPEGVHQALRRDIVALLAPDRASAGGAVDVGAADVLADARAALDPLARRIDGRLFAGVGLDERPPLEHQQMRRLGGIRCRVGLQGPGPPSACVWRDAPANLAIVALDARHRVLAGLEHAIALHLPCLAL